MATGAMCSNESGMDSRRTRMRRSLQSDGADADTDVVNRRPQVAHDHSRRCADAQITEVQVAETAQQYTARIVGNVGDQDPWPLLEAAPARLRSLVERASPGALTWK